MHVHGYDVNLVLNMYLNCEIHGSRDGASDPRAGPK